MLPKWCVLFFCQSITGTVKDRFVDKRKAAGPLCSTFRFLFLLGVT